jgi:Domain of unknown function (DUF932)
MLNEAQLQRKCPAMFAESAHASRSERYGFVPTIQVVRKLYNEGFVPVEGMQANCRDESRASHTKHLLRFRRSDQPIDGLVPEVLLLNSHDGTSAYQLFGGLFRFACLNGLVIGDCYQRVHVAHTKSQVRDVIEGSFTVIEESRKALTRAREMSQVMLSGEETMLLATSVHSERFGASDIGQLVKPEQLLKAQRVEDIKSDLFSVLNRLQEHAIRGGIKLWDKGRRVRTREVKGIDQSVKLNKAVWNFGEQLMQLKAA